jgi:hypothetical protein
MSKLKMLGMFIGASSMFLGWYWFSWKFSLVIFLAIFGNNLEKNNKNDKG